MNADQTIGKLPSNQKQEDITECWQNEILLKQLKAAIDISMDGFWIVDLAGKLLQVNEAYAKISGYTVDELTNMYINQIDTIHDLKLIKARMKRIIAKGKDRFETCHRHKDGHEIAIEVSAVYLPEFQYFCSFFRDVTESKKAENAIKSADRCARGLIEVSLDPLVTIGYGGKITDANTATERITGVHRGNLIGSHFSGYFTEPEKATEGYQRTLSQGVVNDYALTIRHISGRVSDVLYNASRCCEHNDNTISVYATVRDLTEIKKSISSAIVSGVMRLKNKDRADA